MKIAINTCYGGFGLSKEAMELYLERKIILDNLDDFKVVSIKGIIDEFQLLVKKEYDPKSWDDLENIPNSDKKIIFADDIKRNDPILIEIIEKLGDKANGDFAELEIVDIPKGTMYKIDYYDGNETIDYRDGTDWDIAT